MSQHSDIGNRPIMQRVHRTSISDKFEVLTNQDIPEVPSGGVRVKVYYAGATYTDKQVHGNKYLRTPGVHDTSLFPGYEISGIIDKICNKAECNFKEGDRVIVYPEDSEILDSGFADFVVVKNANNIIPVPNELSLQVAALLPCGALLAYTSVKRVKHFIQQKSSVANSENPVNLLIVGAGGLGLWTLKMARYLFGDFCEQNLHLTVADTSIEKLMVAKDQGCYDVIHWNDSIHEEYILERTKDVCKGGVDVAIDFVSSPRTINRITKVLKEEGVVVVGGHSKYEITLPLNEIARKNQSFLGVHRGKKRQLVELINIVAKGEVKPPRFSIFPVADANKVFEQLQECRITGRAVLAITGKVEEQSDKNDNL